MLKLELHPSGLAGFFNCSYAWFRDNLSDKPIRRVGSAAHIGTGIHKGAEVFYEESMSRSEWLNYNSAYADAAIEKFRARIKDDEPSDIKELNMREAEQRIVDYSKKYIEKAPSFTRDLPIKVEQNYVQKVRTSDRLDVTISGTLDVEYEEVFADIKTMSRLNNPSKYVLQQGLYALLREAQGLPVEDIRIHRVCFGKGSVDSVRLYEGTMDDVKKHAKTALQTVIDTMELYAKTGDSIVFRGNPSSMLCSEKYCPYFKECKWRL